MNDCRHWNEACNTTALNDNGHGHTVPDAWARIFLQQLHYFHTDWDLMKKVKIPIDDGTASRSTSGVEFNELLDVDRKMVFYSGQ